MKNVLLLCLLFLSFNRAQCQQLNYGLYIPSSETSSSTGIAAYVQFHFSTDREKISAVYSWVTTNIQYSTDSMYNINWGPDASVKVSAALRRKKGVCENFAAVFTDILIKAGIPSFVVNGYTTFTGNKKITGHSWSAVFVDKEWLLCDPTWDIGNHTNYFLVSPQAFIESHMPFDPLWQLLDYPITQQQFNRGQFASKKTMPWNVADSVKAFLQLDSLHQMEAASHRMQQTGAQNNVAAIWQSYVKMKIAIVYGDRDMDLYNGAVDDLNKATAIFNAYVQYRNNRFLPARPDAEIRTMLGPAQAKIKEAIKKADGVGKAMEDFQYDTGTLKEKLERLQKKVMEQDGFLRQYTESSVADRGRLFYQ